MASIARVVCWQSRDEWTEIYRCLYSFHDADLQRKGISRVMAWKSRSGDKLPLAVESTANLISAHLADNDSGSFAYQVQLTVSMALVRFVNGMADMNQKGLYARSVQSIAEEIGLPDWLVDLRHEATHATLPSQQTSRAGVQVALRWLQKEYWEAQEKMHVDAEEKLLPLIRKYQGKMLSRIKKKKGKKKVGQVYATLVQEIVNLVSTNNLWSNIQVLLLEQGILTSTVANGELELTLSEGKKSDTVTSLPEELVMVWIPLFVALDKVSAEFIPSLLLSILDSFPGLLENQTSSKPSIDVMAWAEWLLHSCSTSPSSFTCRLPWSTLLEIALANPTIYTRRFIDLILKQIPAIPENMKQRISDLVNAYFSINTEECTLQQGFDCKFLEKLVEERKIRNVQNNDPKKTVAWSKCFSNTQWHLIPFGEVLGTNNRSSDRLELTEFLERHGELVTSQEAELLRNEIQEEGSYADDNNVGSEGASNEIDKGSNSFSDYCFNTSSCNNLEDDVYVAKYIEDSIPEDVTSIEEVQQQIVLF